MSDNKKELNDSELENVSGGAGLVLPDYMQGMSKQEIGQVMRDPDFVGTPEWQEIMDLNSDRVSKMDDRREARRANLGRDQ
ncbi:MAG TPA: hypothetical protein DCS15_00910 [Flavobacteriales bacterium]|jgi:bacteriocin-like protein|nr:hypothetical protein [Flavobacteriales bacterium]